MSGPNWFEEMFIDDVKAILPEPVEGAEINNQDITVTENGEYTAEPPHTGLGTVTVNVDTPDYTNAEGIKF